MSDESGRGTKQYCPHCDEKVEPVNAVHWERGPSQHCPECESWDLYDSWEGYAQAQLDQVRHGYGEFCLKVPSLDGHHYIRYTEDAGWKAVYEGPHGPENRPANLKEVDRWNMLEMADDFELVTVDQSPWSEPEVAGHA